MAIGRPVSYELIWKQCERCGGGFRYKAYPKRKRPRFCSQFCARSENWGKRRKLPNRETTAHHYLIEGKTLMQIGELYGCSWESVRAMLHRTGITMRKKTVTKTCIAPGCTKPAAKIYHKAMRSFYGRRCFWHRKLHIAKLARDYQRRVRNISPSKWRLAV